MLVFGLGLGLDTNGLINITGHTWGGPEESGP